MRLFDALVHRAVRLSRARAALAAGLACTLVLSGCASWRNQTQPAAPVNTTASAVEADAGRSASLANAGAQTTQSTKLQKFLWIFSPYRPDIQQGNFVSAEMLSQLKVGQTREQVRFLLGTPMLMDMFHADRWDFPFYLARGNGELTTSRVTVFFKDDVVERFEGGNLPTEREYIARIAGPIKTVAKDAKKAEAVANSRPVAPETNATPATSTTTP
jgi:outer membrane protein assembly factor BamE